MKYLALALTFMASVCHAQGSNYFVPGCALTGSATSQVVNLSASGCIVGNLPVANLFGGTGASGTTYLSGTGWSTPAGVPGGASTQVQYNNAGAFAGNQGLAWSVSTNTLLVGDYSTSSNGIITVGGTSTGTGTLKSGGGQMTVQGAPLILTTTGGTAISIAGSAGTGTGAGSSINITAGNTGASSTSRGGAIQLTGGTGNASEPSGNVVLTGGSGYATTGTAAGVVLQGGVGNTNALSGDLYFQTFNTTRLTIDPYGAWYLGGSAPGAAGQFFTSQGAGTPPLWTSGPAAAAPTASVGLTAVPGSASTFMRSDAAPALNTAISPYWTGAHVFQPPSGVTPLTIIAPAGTAESFAINNNANTVQLFIVGNDGGVIVPPVTGGGDKGAGSINAGSLYVSGNPVINTTSSPTLTGSWTFDAGAVFSGSGGISILGPAATQDDVLTFGQSGQSTWQLYSLASSNDQHLYNNAYGDVLIFGGNGGVTTAGQTNEGAGTINAGALYTQGVRVTKTAFGLLTTPGGGAVCGTAFSGGIGNCSSSGTGNANFGFVSGYFTNSSAPPMCTFTPSLHTQTIDINTITTTGFNITTYTSGTPSTAAVYVICVGLY